MCPMKKIGIKTTVGVGVAIFSLSMISLVVLCKRRKKISKMIEE